MRRGASRRPRTALSRETDILRRIRPPVALTALLLLAATALPARASWMVPGSPYRAKDFALVQHDGLYHLFYIRHNWTLPTSQTEKDLGHAVSRDLWNWTQLSPVLAVRDTSWDRTHVWAPSIVKKDGVFYMFYTGVASGPGTEQLWQRIGVATSTDLMEWTRFDVPVLSCLATPWAFCDSTTENTAFRDPHVMADPARPGHWLMYYSANPSYDPSAMVLGMAESDDLLSWTDLGPLWATYRQSTGTWVAESGHLFPHEGQWWLFFTTTGTKPLRFMTGPDPTGAPSTWTQRGALGDMLGLDTAAWYASEFFSEGLVDYFAYVIADRVDVKKVVWGSGGDSFVLVQPDLMHVKAMTWDGAQVEEGATATLSIVAANPYAGVARLEALRVRPDGSTAPVALAELGLPETVTLTADTTRVTWQAAWLPDSTETSGTLPLVVRLTDQTCAAAVLAVTGRPLVLGTPAWDRDTVPDEGTAALAIPATDWAHRTVGLEAFRVVPDSLIPLAPAALGLPGRVPLTGDTTRVTWTARWVSGPPDSGSALVLLVRLAGATDASLLTVLPPPPLEVTAMAWDRDTVPDDSLATLSLVTVRGEGRSVALAAWRVAADSTLVPVEPDSLGLPAEVPVTGDTTRVAWTARWLREGPDTTLAMRLVVGAADSSAAAPPLTVLAPPPLEVTGMAWDRDSVPDDSLATLAVAARHWAGRAILLEAWRLRDDSTLVRIPSDSLGLPAEVPMTGDTTRVAWSARWLREGPDTTQAMRLVVRVPDGVGTAPPLAVLAPPPLVVTALAWDRDTVDDAGSARLDIVAEGWSERAVRLEAWRLVDDSTRVPAPLDSLGLPELVALTGDTTSVPWSARWLAHGPDTTLAMRLVVRIADSSATAPVLAVIPQPPLELRAMGWDSLLVREGSVATLRIAAANVRARAVAFEAHRAVDDTTFLPLDLAALGLPGQVPLQGDTTLVPWSAVWLPFGDDSSRALQLRLRIAGDTLLAPAALVVLAPHLPPAGVGGGPPAVARDGLRAVREGAGWALAACLERALEARCDLFDTQGRRVRRLHDGPLPAGVTLLRWDGRADDGRMVSAGLYFARLSTVRSRATARLLRLR